MTITGSRGMKPITTGFFSDEEVRITTPINKKISDTVPACSYCKLYKSCISPKMKPSGKGKKGILIIGEAPGENEDKRGTHFVGVTGSFLRERLEMLDVDLDRDCWKVNAINCRPINKIGGDREPTNNEINYCRPIVWNAIREYKPKVIILLGKKVLQSFLGHRWKKGIDNITKWVGWTIPDQDVKAWVIPTYHPSFIVRNDHTRGEDMALKEFDNHLQMALDLTERKFPTYTLSSQRKKVEKILDTPSIIQYLKRINKEEGRAVAFDYETTGLKPHSNEQKILCVSLCSDFKKSYTFPLENPKVIEEFIKFLRNPRIKKIASNMKYEHNWSRVKLKTIIKGWLWDTMLAAHIIDNRRGITSLKFQTYVQFGIVDYDSEISRYLETEYGNDINKAETCDFDKMLEYNGLDSLFEYKLAYKQIKELGLKEKLQYFEGRRAT